jgi:hypothetical protein
MKYLIAVFSIFISFQAGAQSDVKLVPELKRLIEGEDQLGARVLLQTASKSKLNYQTWLRIRNLLQENEVIGWDAIYAWEKLNPQAAEQAKSDVNQSIARGDALMLKKKFNEAIAQYQNAARKMKAEIDKGSQTNSQLYTETLHSLARALFGAGKYNDSVEVYSWIKPPYPRFRHVLFEKMWAAFHAKKIDVANGSIASQYSSYFSRFLEPESYLVQIYIYRKLCRKDDLNLAVQNAREFEKLLSTNTYTMAEWAKTDFDTMTQLYIVNNSKNVSSKVVSEALREREKNKILKNLQTQFDIDRKRLAKEMKKVNAYINLAAVEDNKVFEPVVKIEMAGTFKKQIYEYWPAVDREDWLDELGYFYFVGGSQCASK